MLAFSIREVFCFVLFHKKKPELQNRLQKSFFSSSFSLAPGMKCQMNGLSRPVAWQVCSWLPSWPGPSFWAVGEVVPRTLLPVQPFQAWALPADCVTEKPGWWFDAVPASGAAAPQVIPCSPCCRLALLAFSCVRVFPWLVVTVFQL